MGWLEKTEGGGAQASYTSPSGQRIEFTYENLGVNFARKTAAFEFPDSDGTYVQDLGHTGRRYPLRVIFWGADYEVAADAFMGALRERGFGSLRLPLYGTVSVVPFGEIKRRDDLKTAANQAVFEVTFFETTGIAFPGSQIDLAMGTRAAYEAYNAAKAAQDQANVDALTAAARATRKSKYTRFLDSARSVLRTVADAQDDVKRQFDTIYDSIDSGISVLIGDPLTLAFQTSLLLQAPARALTAIRARLDAYKVLLQSFTEGDAAVLSPSVTGDTENEFFTQDLFASGAVSGEVVSVINHTYATRTEAVAAAETVLEDMETLTTWRDDNYESLGLIDTGEAYQALQEAVALAAGHLVELAFSLKQERSLTLARARTPLDLVAELYGTVDADLDFFITSNDLTGSEILELPAGRTVVYYV